MFTIIEYLLRVQYYWWHKVEEYVITISSDILLEKGYTNIKNEIMIITHFI